MRALALDRQLSYMKPVRFYYQYKITRSIITILI